MRMTEPLLNPLLGLFSSCGVATSNFDSLVFLHPVIFYLVMFGCYLLEACTFLMRDRKGADPEERGGGEELGGIEEEKL